MWHNLRTLWEYRYLVLTFIERDIKARYRQTTVGIGWAVIQPLLMTGIFTIIFSKFLHVSTHGIPYPLFSFIALSSWTFLSRSLTSRSIALTSNQGLISKVYFPRDVLPIATVASLFVDFGISSLLIPPLLFIYHLPLTWHLVFLPLVLAIQVLLAISFALLASSAVIVFRDLVYVIPFLVQIGLYASPIVYSVKNLQPQYQAYFYLNPITGVVEGFRSILLYQEIPNLTYLSISLAFALILFIITYHGFKRVEQYLADVI